LILQNTKARIINHAAVTVLLMLTVMSCRAFNLLTNLFDKHIRSRARFALVTSSVIVLAVLLGATVSTVMPITVRDHAAMSDKERGRYVRTLADRIGADPRMFLKLVAADVKLLLDEPGLQRADGPIAVWQYRSESCVLDVYLATQPDSNTQRVVDYEARSRVKARMGQDPAAFETNDSACFQSVLAANRPTNRVVLASLN
jgi:hypothetical protein